MLAVKITNTSGASIGAGTDTPLPRPFDWATIANNASKTFPCREDDLLDRQPASADLPPIDKLQLLKGTGKITVEILQLEAGRSVDIAAALGLTAQTFVNETRTANATPKIIHTVPIPTDKVVTVDVTVVGIRDTEAEAASYRRIVTYRNAAGTVSAVGSATAVSTQEDVAGMDVTFNVTGTTLEILVTGANATNMGWRCHGTVVSHAY